MQIHEHVLIMKNCYTTRHGIDFWTKSLIVYVLILPLTGIWSRAQDGGCRYVDKEVKVFTPEPSFLKKAKQLVTHYKSLSENKDSVTLIGVSKRELLKDISIMLDNPNTTQLNDSGYYCGVVVVLNWMLNKRPDLYVQGVVELAFNGEVNFENGAKTVKLPRALLTKVNYSLVGLGAEKLRYDLGVVSLSDFILGVSLVHSEKVIQRIGLLWNNSTHRKANIGNFLFANTMPWELDDYFKTIGVKDVLKNYYLPFENKKLTLDRIENAVENGEIPILMENHILTSDRHKNLFYKIFGAHFITVHWIQLNKACKTISLSYWDYGSVKNYREQSKKGSPLAAKTLRGAIRRNSRLNKIKEGEQYLEITYEQFFKGLKGYWVPGGTSNVH